MLLLLYRCFDADRGIIGWAVQRGTVPLGKSSKKERIASNLAVRKLSEEDFEAINGLALPGTEGRTVDFSEVWGIKLFTD